MPAKISRHNLNKWRNGRGSNPRPPAWQAGILTNWTTAPPILLRVSSRYLPFTGPALRAVQNRSTRFCQLPDVTLITRVWCLAVSYSRMGRPHTTIGATAFHFWVRHGIRWDHRAMAARQILFQLTRYTVPCTASQSNLESSLKINITLSNTKHLRCCKVKPHGSLVLVSSMHRCTYTPSLSTS